MSLIKYKKSAIQSSLVIINFALSHKKPNAAGHIVVDAPMGAIISSLKKSKKDDYASFIMALHQTILDNQLKDKARSYIDYNPIKSFHSDTMTFNIEGDNVNIVFKEKTKNVSLKNLKNVDPMSNKLS